MHNPKDQAKAIHLAFPRRIIVASLRIFFKLLYHQFAWTYDSVAWLISMGAWRTWVEVALPYLAGPQVLEIGFGPGYLLRGMEGKGLRAFGLDESASMVRLARKHLSAVNAAPNLMRGRAEYLPIAAESMHQVVITFPAEFVLLEASLDEIKRVLVAGGNVIIIPMAWITGRKPWQRLAAMVGRITGEAPAWDEKALVPLQNRGFNTAWKMIDFPFSRVLLIQLTKAD